MSVLVKGMKMPDKCLNCPFMISRDNDDCILQSTEANELAVNWEDLKSGCPLVEVPEKHGRVIDADALFGWYKGSRTKYPVTSDYSAYNTMMMYEIFDEIDVAPTVIKAEDNG